jgi:hypothetical protein
MTKAKFSELSSVPHGIVEAWIDRGHVENRLIGEHRLVNVASLWRKALEGEER